MMADQDSLLHGIDAREFKFYPKVLGVALKVLADDVQFCLEEFLAILNSNTRK